MIWIFVVVVFLFPNRYVLGQIGRRQFIVARIIWRSQNWARFDWCRLLAICQYIADKVAWNSWSSRFVWITPPQTIASNDICLSARVWTQIQTVAEAQATKIFGETVSLRFVVIVAVSTRNSWVSTAAIATFCRRNRAGTVFSIQVARRIMTVTATQRTARSTVGCRRWTAQKRRKRWWMRNLTSRWRWRIPRVAIPFGRNVQVKLCF